MVAISVDDETATSAFAEKERFGFPLLSDPGGRVAALYGVLRGARAGRASFVLDERGLVRHADTQIRLSQHGDDLVERIRALRR